LATAGALGGCAEKPQPDPDVTGKPRDAAAKAETETADPQSSGIAKNDPETASGAATQSHSTGSEQPASLPAASDTKTNAKVTVEVVTPDQFQDVIARHKGQVVLVDFWATWCAPCRSAFPHIVEMAKKHEDLVLVTMNFDDIENKETVLEFLADHKATFDNLISKFGGEDESYRDYDIDNDTLPHYKLYGRDGKLAHKFATEELAEKQFTKEDIEAKVKELLAEK
jgi:thiol-disulfide isomerase/thioredoxin